MALSLAQERPSYTPTPPPVASPAMDIAHIVDPVVPQEPTTSTPAPKRPHIQLPKPTDASETCLDVATIYDDRKYSLEVVQQPIRARMCGFGDKDRRPITPPPCIRLLVQDAKTCQDIDINDIDHSYFVLTVDLWSADGQKEVNLVRHSTCSPSISAGSTTSYPPPLDPPRAPDQLMDGMGRPLIDGHGRPITGQVVLQAQTTMYGRGRQDYSQNRNYPRQNQLSDHMEQFQREQQYTRSQHSQVIQSSQTQEGHYTSAAVTPSTPTSLTGFYGQHHQQGPLLSPDQMPQTVDPRSQANGMFTRNLIGSLCVSAFKLTNEDGEVGIWFILQDLSIRTEGTFRLKMNFVNVGYPIAQTMVGSIKTGKLNTESAPVLASCYSEEFIVYSAKKFPGVIESTELSKVFATQGIKIPIRKDGPRGNERRPGDGDDDD